jgi:hypothetical protein
MKIEKAPIVFRRSFMIRLLYIIVVFCWIGLFSATLVYGHCDSMNGPVIADARKALETGNVTPVLKWIKPEYESEIKQSFQTVMEVRRINADAKKLADYSFFETVVRLHRAGEGAPYTGLKEESPKPIIEQADRSLETGSMGTVSDSLARQVQMELENRFRTVIEKKKHANESVEAGREYVEAYVSFVHYVEALDRLAAAENEHPHEHE